MTLSEGRLLIFYYCLDKIFLQILQNPLWGPPTFYSAIEKLIEKD